MCNVEKEEIKVDRFNSSRLIGRNRMLILTLRCFQKVLCLSCLAVSSTVRSSEASTREKDHNIRLQGPPVAILIG